MQKQWVQDISISQELAVTLIGQQFPGLSHIVVKPFSHGWDNILFQVNGKFVFRFPRRVIAVPLLERESRALPVLAHHVHLPVPDLLFRGQPTPEFPYPFFGYTMLSGRSIHQANLDETKRVSAAEGMATFLKELHGVPEDSIDAMQLEPDTIGRLDVGRRIPKLEEYLKDIADRKLYDDIDSLFQILRDLPAASPASARRTVVHGDFNFRNFLVASTGELSGVIDWGDIHVGDPAVDLAVVHTYFPPAGRAAFFKVYGDVSDQTWKLSRFRALYVTAYLLLYADDIRDRQQFQEAHLGLRLLAQPERFDQPFDGGR